MKRLIQWHNDVLNKLADYCGLTAYQIMWIAFAKGLVIGYIVGAYLKLIEGCDVIDYNVRPPGGGMAGLSELDVVGLDFIKENFKKKDFYKNYFF